jgi:hypothetical protein
MAENELVRRNILAINKDGSLSVNYQEFNATLCILDDDTKEFPIEKGKLQIPDDQINNCIWQYHHGPWGGHPGITKTVEQISRKCQFKNMCKHVWNYITKCTDCQQNKHATHAKYGHIQFAEIPDNPWKEITMDFIVKLPLSKDPMTKDKYNSIFIVVDKLIKYTHFISFKETYTAAQLAFILLDRIIQYHGMPKAITSDRGVLFTSNYWKTLLALIGMKQKLSTAYHPQTDGQTERMNQSLETYL